MLALGDAQVRVTTRGRYALRAAIDIASHGNEEPILRRELADRQELSVDYVAQLLRMLREAEIVESVRGPGGGYRLMREPSAITAGEVIRAVEGPTAVVYCVTEPIEPPCPRSEECAARWFWIRLSGEIDRSLDAVSLEDLANVGSRLAEGNREDESSRT
jgi:Rrf2 family protein